MVHEHIRYAKEYFNLSTGIRRALEYLATHPLDELAAGRHDVDGTGVFALVSDYDTRPPAETFWEAHRAHIDVQFVVSGRERIAYGDLAAFRADPYDAERDLVVAHGEATGSVLMTPGCFTILYPHDVHMPGLLDTHVSRVRKVVVKCRIEG
jgi:YhcH/YjgK/YiaL family protein